MIEEMRERGIVKGREGEIACRIAGGAGKEESGRWRQQRGRERGGNAGRVGMRRFM